MNRVPFGVLLVLFILVGVSRAQIPFRHPAPDFVNEAVVDPLGGAEGGQAEPSAFQYRAFTRLTGGATVSLLGMGVELGTNLGPRIDARIFGNYLNLTHNYSQSGFSIALNVEMENTGAKVDFYLLHRLPLRISPGYLFFNQNRVRADLLKQPGATFTINKIDWTSDNADPVNGIGRLLLGGRGFMVTSGLGHIVSHTRKHFTYPFEAGVVFIDTPRAILSFRGEICSADQTQCLPAAAYPNFATNLAAQVATWNRKVAPFHVYPIVEGGVAYSFTVRR